MEIRPNGAAAVGPAEGFRSARGKIQGRLVQMRGLVVNQES